MPSMIRKIEPGDVIGRCRIIRELGRGGVGTVYLATHQTLQIEVALKVLSPALSLDDPALAERFIREAQIAARIRHPNVIAVMDAAHDEATGLYFIVQEYVGGGSLAWHLRNGPLPERRALEIMIGIAQALVVAEENHIVHRDIKPENIMLDLRGTAKLADLGLAKHAIESHITLTLGGSFMGTPAYMSPEQARDAKVADTRDDIYSLGATFYECLTGEAPFKGETPYNIMSELLTKPSPRARDRRPELSRSIDLVCRKMMAKTRQLRYANARALLQDLYHCEVVTDAGLDGLEAASFEEDALSAGAEARELGVHDGATNVPKAPGERGAVAPGADHGAFRAAAILIALVTGATLLFAWMAQQHLWSNVREQVAILESGFGPEKKKAVVHHEVAKVEKHHEVKEAEESSPAPRAIAVTPVPDVAPTNAVAPVAVAVGPDAVPVVLPATNFAAGTNVAIPAVPALPDSAFAAREVAERSLPAELVGAGGHADLLRVRGKHDARQVTPTLWTFEFFDPKAAGHARIVSVSDHRVVDNGERVTFLISPYTRANVLPADLIDSTQALEIASGLVPGVTVSSSQFLLHQEKGSAPFWAVTLWARNAQGDEVELGEVVMLAQKGDVISNRLRPEKLKE